MTIKYIQGIHKSKCQQQLVVSQVNFSVSYDAAFSVNVLWSEITELVMTVML